MSKETKPTEEAKTDEAPKPVKKAKKTKPKPAGPYALKASKKSVLPPSSWRRAKIDGKNAIAATCPFGHGGVIDDSQVAKDGTVKKALDCPVDGCTFKQKVVLMGYGK